MQIFKGKSVLDKIAMGRIRVYKKDPQQITCVRITDTASEAARFHAARKQAIRQLEDLYEKALREIGETNAAIFKVHQMMLEDDDYKKSVETIIRSRQVNAAYAVAAAGDNFAEMFASMNDDYMRGRAADVRDISDRVIRILNNSGTGGVNADEPVILVADDLAPSETVQMDKSKVLSFVTIHGSLNSHTAILARTMDIPALVSTNIATPDDIDGCFAVVDGEAGLLYVEPDEAAMEQLTQKRNKFLEQKELFETLKGKEDITIDGKSIMLYANIGTINDLPTVLRSDAGGIGLFRSEFIYLERDHFPSEEEQFAIYKQVVQAMAGKRVIIRTLDIGADKQCDYFDLKKENNPALGCRAIRICLTRPEIFKTQLRALFRASAFGRIAIMYPMITSVSEVRRIKEIVSEVCEELDEAGIACGTVEQGIMIETPAAVMISDELAAEVDFFSIGTNDLTQYTLAIDRQNSALDAFYNAHHPAVLRMIEMTVKSAHAHGIWAGICGELAADLSLTQTFLKMGVDELSVTPGRILPLRKVIRETDTSR